MLVNRNGLGLSEVNTNENGQFRIPLHSEAETIVCSMIGFKTQELPLSGNTEFEVFLLEDLAELEGVEVVAERDPDVDLGFLTIDKSEMSSAVASIDMEGLDKVPVTSVDQLIQGAAPGLQVVAASGDPGAAASIRIRGISSISGIKIGRASCRERVCV